MKNRVVFVLLVVPILLIAACSEKQADIVNVKSYQNDGVSFSYPGNWEVSEDSKSDGFRYLSMESPGEALVKVEIYPGNEPFDLDEFVQLDIEQLKIAMPGFLGMQDTGEIEETQFSLANSELSGYRYIFGISIFGIDIPHTSEYYMFTSESNSAYIITQVATEDLQKVRDGFNLILEDFKIL